GRTWARLAAPARALELQAGGEPRGLHAALVVVRRGPVTPLRGTRRGKTGDGDAPLCDEPVDVADVARQHRQEAHTFTCAPRTEAAELMCNLVGPFLDAACQPPARCDELRLLLDHVAVELDLPELAA